MIGVNVTMQDLNFKSGDITTNLNDYFNKGLEIKEFLDVHGQAGLISLGFTAGEADIMISAFNDLVMAKEAFDSSAFIKQLYGMGIK